MSSREKNKYLLNLERDMPLPPQDFEAMRKIPNLQDNSDLAAYLDFLEEIGAFKTKKTEVKIYPEQFKP